jgi:streptomycin 6-kinase
MWEVPEAFTIRMAADPSQSLWVARLPQETALLAERWRLRRDGTAWSGHMSTVWPVRTATGDQAVLKISWIDSGSRAEPIALRAWAGLPAVGLLAHDEPAGACTVIGMILASLTSVPAPQRVPPLEVEVQRIADAIAAHQRTLPGVLPTALVDRALASLRELVQELDRRTRCVLVHGDCHFLNVLHTLPAQTLPAQTLPAQAAGWVAIDPLPSAGIPEWDVTALLRNRWEDAVATGDADAQLRRRVDLVSEITGMDSSQVRAIAQAVAVDNLLWLLPRDRQHMFVPPYEVMSTWRD